MDSKKIGCRINAALADRNKKQLELADYLHVQPNTISYFCSGKRTPNTMQIIEIAKFLNVSTDYLLGLSDVPTRDVELKAVCEYTGLSQTAVINICAVTEKENEIGVLSKIFENNNFWKIQHLISDATAQKSFLLPNPTYIIDTINRELKGEKLTRAYIHALRYVGRKGTAPIFRNELFESITDLFDEITGFNDMLENGYDPIKEGESDEKT